MKWSLAGLLTGVLIVVLAYSSRPLMLVNGQILTMDSHNTVVTSLGVRAGVIQALGTPLQVQTALLDQTGARAWFQRFLGVRKLDLRGQTVIPGIIDAHSHFPASGLLSQGVDLSGLPVGGVSDMATLLSAITAQAQRQSAKRWIISFSYDDSALAEKRHPTRRELDMAAPEHAVYLRHRSGHMGVANSRALSELGFELDSAQHDASKQAVVSQVGRDRQPLSGLLQNRETPAMQRLLREVPWWRKPAILLNARDEYLRAGVTTLQNGYADKGTLQMLRVSRLLRIVPQRIVVWPAHDKLTDSAVDSSVTGSVEKAASPVTAAIERLEQWPRSNSDTLHIGAIKLIADGSPQGRTAWLSEPYLPDESLLPEFTGTAYQQEASLHELIASYHRAGFQLAIHGNGDAAIQNIIEGLQYAQIAYPREDARHIVVHAQTIRHMQLQALAALNVTASFFPTHTHYWGDWYRERALGEPRASQISPLASADVAGLRYSIHTDSPVTPINSMHLLYTATERVTSGGFLLGAEQRISRLRALRAMTIDAAWQNHLDADRGSLETGKLADFVILSDNPLTVDDVRRISLRQVWIGGVRHFP